MYKNFFAYDYSLKENKSISFLIFMFLSAIENMALKSLLDSVLNKVYFCLISLFYSFIV